MNIIVTGASRGIGYELVKAYAAESGVKNVIAISRNGNALDKLKEECIAINKDVNVIPLVLDLGSEGFEDILVPVIKKQMPHIDIVVNNAGYLVSKPFTQLTDEDIYSQYNVNVFAIFRLLRVCMPMIEAATKPHIVNISSVGGYQGSVKFPGLSAYSSSKAAVVGLTECLAEELKDTAISVNCLALGAVDTEMLQQAFPGYKAPTTAVQMAEYIKEFSISGNKYYNGKVLPVSLSTP